MHTSKRWLRRSPLRRLVPPTARRGSVLGGESWCPPQSTAARCSFRRMGSPTLYPIFPGGCPRPSAGAGWSSEFPSWGCAKGGGSSTGGLAGLPGVVFVVTTPPPTPREASPLLYDALRARGGPYEPLRRKLPLLGPVPSPIGGPKLRSTAVDAATPATVAAVRPWTLGVSVGEDCGTGGVKPPVAGTLVALGEAAGAWVAPPRGAAAG